MFLALRAFSVKGYCSDCLYSLDALSGSGGKGIKRKKWGFTKNICISKEEVSDIPAKFHFGCQ